MIWRVRHRIRYWWANRKASRHIRPGDFYEDCRYHPMICHSYRDGELMGVSLITGHIGCCDYFHCGVIKFENWKDAQKAAKDYIDKRDRTPCKWANSNICVAEGCYDLSCLKEEANDVNDVPNASRD